MATALPNAAGVLAAENIEETLPLPEDFTGSGTLFMLRVRGDSMIEVGIFGGDHVVVRQQDTADPGDRGPSRPSCAAWSAPHTAPLESRA